MLVQNIKQKKWALLGAITGAVFFQMLSAIFYLIVPLGACYTRGMTYTTDPNDPALGRGVDTEVTQQHKKYLVLSEEERAKGFIRPLRRSYIHTKCGVETKMGLALCETYARQPSFYGATYCVGCSKHLPVAEFTWSEDGQVVGS